MLTMHVAYREVSYIISPLADFFLIAHDVQAAAVAVQMTSIATPINPSITM